jgi:RHS repeat-associated protein
VPQLTAVTDTAGTVTDLTRGPGGWASVQTAALNPVAVAQDARGSTVPSTGNTLARNASYTAYGTPAGANTFEPKLGYRGELTLDNQLYLRARNYQPALGQFLTRDPAPGRTGTTTLTNAYHYTDNDPMNGIDPTGRTRQSNTGETTPGKHKTGLGSGRVDPAGPGPILPPPGGFPNIGDMDSLVERLTSELPGIARRISNRSSIGDGVTISMGVCGEYDIGFVSGAAFQGCLLLLSSEIGLAGTVGAGLTTGKGSVEIGALYTNAKTLEELRGYSVCLGLSAGEGLLVGGQICASLDDNGDLTDVYSFYGSVGAGVTLGGASLQLTFNKSFATKLFSTPKWLRPIFSFTLPNFDAVGGPQIAPGPERSLQPDWATVT